jgi:hypothetical protein
MYQCEEFKSRQAVSGRSSNPVQHFIFVRDYNEDGNGEFNIMRDLDDDNCEMVDSLVKEVLEILPRQVSEYFQLVNLSP